MTKVSDGTVQQVDNRAGLDAYLGVRPLRLSADSCNKADSVGNPIAVIGDERLAEYAEGRSWRTIKISTALEQS